MKCLEFFLIFISNGFIIVPPGEKIEFMSNNINYSPVDV